MQNFSMQVITIKNYNEAMLESMNNGILSTNADKKIVKVNTSAHKLLWYDSAEELWVRTLQRFFTAKINGSFDAIDRVLRIGTRDEALDATILLDPSRKGEELAHA